MRSLAALLLAFALGYSIMSGSGTVMTVSGAPGGVQRVRPAATAPIRPAATEPAQTEAVEPAQAPVAEPAGPSDTPREGEKTGPQPAPPGEEEGETGAQPVTSEVLLVNKTNALPAGYVPDDLRAVEIRFSFDEDLPKRKLRDEAAGAVERLFEQAEQEGIELVGVSGYRSYETQQAIFASATERYGSEEAANRLSARPGESEHQTGLALDVSSPEVGGALTEAFGETEAGRWLAENAADFGFVIRYLKGAEQITGYSYEPWHIRYVGVAHAARVAERGLTLEEYLGEETARPQVALR